MNFAALPGNWWIVAGSATFCYLSHRAHGSHGSWYVVGLLMLLAVIGELLEFVAGTAGAAKVGASRRAMALSVVGSIVGSVVGAMAGVVIPIPVLGSAIGALLGGACGAALGAVLGEHWKGRERSVTLDVGAGAFVGRILGTVGKIVVGGMMFVIATIDSVW